jgi:hypothetical protein
VAGPGWLGLAQPMRAEWAQPKELKNRKIKGRKNKNK